MAEWLRRQPAKLMGFARVGSNPTVVAFAKMRSPGIEPGSITWQATIITTRPRAPDVERKKTKTWGDARIELATSCTRSKNHTTRPITQTHCNKKAPEVRLELTTYRLTAGRWKERLQKWIQHHTVPGWSPTPVLSGLKPR